MKCLESLTVHSKEELSSLWNIVKDRFPSQSVWMQKSLDGDYTLAIKKQYIEQFYIVFSKWLHQRFCPVELKKTLLEYHMLSSEEKEIVFQSALKKANEFQEEMIFLIRNQLQIMLEIYGNLKLEGFLCFCMQNYREKLEEIVEDCLEAYLSQQEYLEFLELLSYYVEIEEYRFGHLIAIAQDDGSYCCYDENLHNITQRCTEQFYLECHDKKPEPDDFFITILILMLPERVSIYGVENIHNRKFLNTLRCIFKERVSFYHGKDVFLE